MNFSRSTKLLPLNTDRLPLYINVLLTTKRYFKINLFVLNYCIIHVLPFPTLALNTL